MTRVPTRLSRIAALVGAAMALAACGGGDDDSGPSATPTAAGEVTQELATDTLAHLCELEERTQQTTDAQGVREAFEEAHQGLHVVAAEIQKENVRRAAELLEAKRQVEVALSSIGPGVPAPVEAVELREATAAAIEALGLSAPACA